MATKINTIEEIHELVGLLKSAQRKRPVCVVTIAISEDEPGFDLNHLEREAGEVADFYLVKTGDLTREFMTLMPENTQAYGGAARAYPIDFGMSKAASTLRYPIPPVQLKKATAALISDLWGYGHAAGLIAKPAANLKAETVTVEAIFGGETAILKRANGERVSVRAEAVFPGIPLDRVLSKGQQLEGFYDPSNKAFAFASQNPTVDEFVSHYGFDTVTLGLIKSTDRKTAKVAVHPNLIFEVTKAEVSGNERDVLDKYLTVGQVYSFRLYKDPQGHARLKSNDIDDDEIVQPALSLLPGSGPWLEEGLGIVADDQPDHVEDVVVSELELPTEQDLEATFAALKQQIAELTAVPASSPARTKEENRQLSDNAFYVNQMRGQVLAANREAQRAKDEADAIAAERNTLAHENATLKETNRALGGEVSDLRKAKRAAANRSERDPWESRGQFETDAEWLAEEVRRAWIDTFKPADRKLHNIDAVKWTFGERFFDDFNEAAFDDTKVRKIIRTVVELVSNRNSVPGGTEAHPLTDNFKGQIRRKDAGAMRMYVEENTPQAMRLHFWKLDGGGYELNGIEKHDTFKMR